MPRFVLLYHECPANYERPSHWDFMLESNDVLRTWALAELPRDWQAAHERTQKFYASCPALSLANDVTAESLPDHRAAYLDYEGEVGSNRGHVIRVATGTYQAEHEMPMSWSVLLAGEIVAGRIELARSKNCDEMWTLRCKSQAPQELTEFSAPSP